MVVKLGDVLEFIDGGLFFAILSILLLNPEAEVVLAWTLTLHLFVSHILLLSTLYSSNLVHFSPIRRWDNHRVVMRDA